MKINVANYMYNRHFLPFTMSHIQKESRKFMSTRHSKYSCDTQFVRFSLGSYIVSCLKIATILNNIHQTFKKHVLKKVTKQSRHQPFQTNLQK